MHILYACIYISCVQHLQLLNFNSRGGLSLNEDFNEGALPCIDFLLSSHPRFIPQLGLPSPSPDSSSNSTRNSTGQKKDRLARRSVFFMRSSFGNKQRSSDFSLLTKKIRIRVVRIRFRSQTYEASLLDILIWVFSVS